MVIPPAAGGFAVKCGVLREDGSPCPRAALWRRDRPMTLTPDQPAGDPPLLAGTWLWGGVMAYHFGHFLVESTGRLWGLDSHPDVAGLLFVPRRSDARPLSRWQTDFFRLAGWSGDLRVVTAPTRVERLIVPGQGFGLGPIVQGTEAARRYFAGFGANVAPAGDARLYISRSGLSLQKGLLIGEHELEAELVRAGYQIFHPEQHPLDVQIARYKAAHQIIAAEGSALHLFAMVARPHQRLAMIVRRRSSATGQIEAHLRSFGGIETVTLDALARTWARPDTDRKRLALGELNLPLLRRLLVDHGFLDAEGPDWAALDETAVRSRIGPAFRPQLVG